MMWDPGTALLAVSVVAGGVILLPPVARGVGGLRAVIGIFRVIQGRAWAPTVAALGAVGWLVGHWSFAIRHDARCSSHLAPFVFDKTPLRWTIPQYHAQRRRQREMAYR